jgi:molybdopterin molybdotransferase
MLKFKEANKIISETFRELKLRTEEISITNALNRVLAEDIISDVDLPPFDNSAMDGYAIKFNPNIKEWKIVGEIQAGNYKALEIDEQTTVHIMTGGMLPKKCDTVIKIEDVSVMGDKVKLKDITGFSFNLNIRKKGEDLSKGKVAIKKGNLLKPQHIAVAASCGKSKLKVYRKLNIGVIVTGDELIDINEKPGTDKIRASNPYALQSAIKESNMNPINFGIVRDDKSEMIKSVKSALDSSLNILLTSGSVSVGKFDYLKEIFENLGVGLKFWKVSIKPGKPLLFGVYNNIENKTLVFGLPGNPVSILVTYILFVKKHIMKLFGNQELVTAKATIKNNYKKDDERLHFVKGFLEKDNTGNNIVSIVGEQSSGNLAQLSKSNCLIIIEENRINTKAGEIVECIMI